MAMRRVACAPGTPQGPVNAGRGAGAGEKGRKGRNLKCSGDGLPTVGVGPPGPPECAESGD